MTDFRSAFNNKVNYRTFRSTPHYLIPSINQQSVPCTEHYTQHVTDFPAQFLQTELLIPKIETPRIVERGHDAATWLVGEKLRWQKKANILAKRYRSKSEARVSLDSLHGKVMAGATKITVPRKLTTFLKHMSKDPDPEFFGPYNWYYSGGTLSIINWKKKAFVISAQGRYLDKIHLVPFKRSDDSWEVCQSSATTKTAPIQQEPIYQVKAKEVKGRAVLCLRQRNAVAVYLNNPRRLNMELVETHSFKIHGNEKPFTGVDLDTLNPGHFCNSHSDREIKVWDPAYRTPVLDGKASQNSNCTKDNFNYWCGIWYDKEDVNQIIVADKCCVTWHDVRNGLKTTKGICLNSSKQRLPFEMSCEELSLVVPSNYPHQLYLGTTHSLLQIDNRKPVLQPQPVRRWTHMLDGQLLMGHAVPLYGTNSEVICAGCTQQVIMVLGGQICCSQHHPLGLPYTSGNQGIVGLSYLLAPDLKKFDIITQTGNGNIYRYDLKWGNTTKEDPNSPFRSLINKSSETLLPDKKRKKLHATDRYSMHPIYLGLQNATEKQVEQEEPKSLEKRQNWQKSKAELLSFVDVLAPGILDTWGLDEMEEWSAAPSVPSAIDKVQQWLQMNTDPLLLRNDDLIQVNIGEQTDIPPRSITNKRCLSMLDSQEAPFKEQHSDLKQGFASLNFSDPNSENDFVPGSGKRLSLQSENRVNVCSELAHPLSADKPTSKSTIKRKSQILGF